MDAKIKIVLRKDEGCSCMHSVACILEFPVPYPGYGNLVYIREAYNEIYEKHIENCQHTLIIGNPGIGKSLFLPYIVYRMLHEHPEDSIICGHYSMKESVVCIKGKEAHVLSPDECKATHYYYLYDCGQSHDSGIDISLALEAKKSLIFSCPDSDNYKRYYKDCIQSSSVQGVEVFMPTWSWDELEICQEHIHTHLDSNELNSRFALWGGIPRDVFQRRELPDHGKSILSAVIAETSIDVVMSTARNPFSSKFSKVCHKILHMIVEDKNYERCSVVFASQNVAQMVYEKATTDADCNVIKIMSQCLAEPALSGIYGQMFESFCHRLLCSGKKFKVKSLEEDTPTSTDISLKCCDQKKFKHLKSVIFRNETYYIPETKNFKSVDSILPPDRVFQVTVSENHPVELNNLELVQATLECEVLNLYFVVPKEVFPTFRKQMYRTYRICDTVGKKVYKNQKVPNIKQWALCADFTSIRPNQKQQVLSVGSVHNL